MAAPSIWQASTGIQTTRCGAGWTERAVNSTSVAHCAQRIPRILCPWQDGMNRRQCCGTSGLVPRLTQRASATSLRWSNICVSALSPLRTPPRERKWRKVVATQPQTGPPLMSRGTTPRGMALLASRTASVTMRRSSRLRQCRPHRSDEAGAERAGRGTAVPRKDVPRRSRPAAQADRRGAPCIGGLPRTRDRYDGRETSRPRPLYRLSQQRACALPKDFGRLNAKASWLYQCGHVIVGHGILLLRRRRGSLMHSYDRPPFQILAVTGFRRWLVGLAVRVQRSFNGIGTRSDHG
jgi:hypothetical protein